METLDFDEWFGPRQKLRQSRRDYFIALCREIISQQLSGKAANSIFKRFLELFGPKQLTPRAVLQMPDQQIRDAGLSWAKIKYLKNLAEAVETGQLDLKKIDQLDDADVIAALTRIKGVGEWTAEMFLIFTLNREDVFSFGDLGLKKGIAKVYQVGNPDRDRIEKIITPWSPYKSYGSIALWHSLDG